jgi:hypothetical protein
MNVGNGFIFATRKNVSHGKHGRHGSVIKMAPAFSVFSVKTVRNLCRTTQQQLHPSLS